jgi:protein subunit release factor B
MREKLVRLTAKDFRWDFFNGSGAGGQNRNKNKNCVRCFHDPSKSMGSCQDHKSREQNKKLAFERMAATKPFLDWLHLESMRAAGMLDEVKNKVDNELVKNCVVEVKDEKGRWVKSDELKIDYIDILTGNILD